MATMSMNKVIHGAFRRDLDRFIAALSTFPAGSRERAAQLTKAWENFDAQLTHHHEGEAAIAWPALKSVGVSAELLAVMDAEHSRMAEALTATRVAMRALDRSAGEAQAGEAQTAFTDLKSIMVLHLDHEEAQLEEVFQAKRDTPEMKAMGKAFAKVSPTQGGQFFAWVLDGATVEERAAVAHEVPGPVLSVIGGVFGWGYRKNIAPVWQQ